jgi:hypothetical protein
MWQILKREQRIGHAYSQMEQTPLFFCTLERAEAELQKLRETVFMYIGFNEPSHEYNEDGDVFKIRKYSPEECYTLIEIICEENKTEDRFAF